MTLSQTSRGITVTPPEVVFEDVRAGLLFVLTFSVQNTCGETRRLQVIPPRTPVFSLNYEPIGGLAPGLDVRAEVEFQLPDDDEVDDLGTTFAPGEVREYVDKFIIISGKDKVEVPLLARRPTPAVIHNRAVEFGTVSDEKKAFGAVSLINKGSRKAAFSVTWDKTLPLVFSPSEGVLEEGRSYRDAGGGSGTTPSDQLWEGSVARIEVTFDATRWSITEPFRALATLVVPGQEDSVIDLSATVCTQKLKLLDGVTASASELTSAEFGTLHYGCRGEITSVLFNDGPEASPFMVTVEVEGGQRGVGGGTGGAEAQDGKENLPFEVLTFCPTQLGHFRGVLKLSLGSDILAVPIRVVGEASTVGTKQPRPGGIDKLPADFKPRFNFVLSESASGIRRAAEGKEAWLRPKPFQIVNDLARREQQRRDSDAWLTVQRLKRAKLEEDREAARVAKVQGKDWRDPEGGVEIGMGRWMQEEVPVPKLPPAQNEPLFLHVPLDGQGKGDGAADVKADVNKLITRKFKQRPATQAEMRDCAAVIGRDQLAKVDLHFRTLDFGQVTVGSSNVRNLAVTNNLPQAVLAELVGLEGQSELAGTGPPAQVVPAGATAGFDVHFKCHTEQVYRKALKLSINKGAVHQFSLLAHTVPVSIELDREEVVMKFPPASLEATLRHPLALTNEGNATASFSWTTRGAFNVSPEKGTIGPQGTQEAEVVWTPQPGCKTAETLMLKVDGGQDKELQVSGQLPETRCRFVPPGTHRSTARNVVGGGVDSKGGSNVGGSVLDFGRASIGVEIVRTVMLQNTGKSPAAFFVDTPELKGIGISVEPTKGLVEPKQSCTLTVVLRASRELLLDGTTLSADIRGGKAAKILLAGKASIPDVSLVEETFQYGKLTSGGCESLGVTLVNRGSIPASLHLDLSQHEEFHLERKKASAIPAPIPVGAGAGTGDDAAAATDDPQEGRGSQSREVSGIEDVECFDGDSHSTGQPSPSGYIPLPRQWKLLVVPGDTLRFDLVFRPQRPGEHSFSMPLSLEGIPPDGAKRLRVPVSAVGLKPTLTFTSTEGLCWVVDDAYLKEPGPRAEGLPEGDAGAPGTSISPLPPGDPDVIGASSSGPVTPVLYVSPTSGQLSPGEESRIRLTFTPNRAGVLTFALPVWLARVPERGTRPYLTLQVKGFGVFPCLTFTHSPVELPVVPLSVTSRAVFMVENNGFSDMELGAGAERIPVELSFRSAKPVSFSCMLDVFDADGGHYPLPIRGCADNCLLTNFPFVEAYRHRFNFWARDGKAVMFMTEAQIKAQEAKDFKDRQAKRARAKEKQNASTATNQQQAGGDASAHGQSTASLPIAAGNTKADHQSGSITGVAGGSTAGAAGAGSGDDGVDAGIDLSEEPYRAGADESGARVLCAWLNANVATTFIEEFPRSICEAHGRPALEAIETMSGKRVPGQVWRKLGPGPGGGKGSGGGSGLGRADDRVAALMEQYRQMLRYLGEKGCLLNSVRPEELLDRVDYARQRASAVAHGGAPNPTPSQPAAAAATSTQSISSSNRDGAEETRDSDEWVDRSREAWSTVMYQCIRTFMLARVTPRALSALPGVFIVMPTKKSAGGKGGGGSGGGKADTDPELAGSNVLSVGEGVLLKWLSYHLEQANRTCMPKRVSTFSNDLADGAILCQAIASHVPHFHVKGGPLHGFIPVHSTGELSDLSNRELNVSKLLTAMAKLKMDFGLGADDVLDLSDRDGVLLALHLFQALPQLVPKTEVEFKANLGSVVSKSIELKNPSSKAIKYDVTLEGSADFRTKGTEVYLEPGKEADFTVELLPRFSSPVEARLTFWAARNKGGMAPASNMVFALKSKVESVKAVSVSIVEGTCYEPQVSNPFEASVRNASDGRFAVSIKQVMISEHPTVANLNLPGLGRRASAAAVAAVRRRASSVLLSSVPSKSAASAAAAGATGPPKTSRDGGGGKKGRDGGGGANGGGAGAIEDKMVRAEVEAALKFPFYTDQESVSISAGGTASLSLMLLPFSPGEYKCTIMFWNERLGEFAQEVKASVNLPLPIANLPLRITAKDGSGGGAEAVQRELLVPSKNLALQNALLGVLLERFQSDRKTRARQAMISILSDQDHPSTSTATLTDEATKHMYAVEVDSPFFQLPKESVALVAEALGGGGGGGGGGGSGSGGKSGGLTARNTARSGMGSAPPGSGAGETGNSNNKRRDLPKKAELLVPGGGSSTAAAAGGAPAPPLPETNAALLNFFPRAAGTYPCRLLVKRRTRYIVDIRCIEVTAVVDAPRNATALVFRAPAGQKITQEAAYPLTFSPVRATEQDFVSKLLLADLKDKNKPVKFEFDLRGTAEEPLAEGHRVVRCSARERVEQVFQLKNVTGKDLEYTVDSDLPGVSGSPGLTVAAKQQAEYTLSICPQFGGVFTGSLTFTAPGGLVVWYTVEVQASNPLEEDKVSISTVLRQAVSVEISLSNPLNEELRFLVSLQGEGVLGDPTFTLDPLASSTYTLYYSPLRVQSHSGSVTFSAEAVGQFWYRLELRADPCPPVRLDEISCPVGASRGVVVSIDNPVGRDIVLASKSSNHRNFSVEPSEIAIGPYGTAAFEVVYTPSSLGTTELGELMLTHADLGEWVFEASGVGEMPGVMQEHRAVATVGSTTSTMFPFRNPFPEPLLLTVLLKSSGDHLTGHIVDREHGSTGGSMGTEDDESSNGMDRDRDSAAGGSDGGGGGGRGDKKAAGRGGRVPFVLLLKKAADLVLQPFQALQVPLSFSPAVIVEDRAVVEIRGQLGGRSLTWVFPIVGTGEAPKGLRVFSIACPAKSSTREDYEVELVGLAGVQEDEEFEFEVAMPEDASLKRRATKIDFFFFLTMFRVSLEPLKPFRAIVEVIIKRKTGGGRWRYEVKVEATEAPPDDRISLRASVGGVSSAVFRLCNRYLGYAPFQAYFTADSALSLSVEPSDGVLTPFGTDGTPVTVTYSPTRYAPNQKGRLIVETEDIRWSYAVTGDFPGFRPPTGVSSKVDSGSHVGSRKRLTGSTKGGGGGGRAGTNRSRSAAVRTPGGDSAVTERSWNGGGGGGVDVGRVLSHGWASRLQSPAAGSK
eukprot:g8875.t1